MISRMFSFIPLLLLLSATLFGQTNYAAEGDKAYKNKDYKGALSCYFRALRSDPNNAGLFFKIGHAYLNTETAEASLSFLEKAYKLNPEVDTDILYDLAMSYQCNYQYGKAKLYYEKYKPTISRKRWPEIDQKIQECIVSHSLLSNPLDIIIENAGSTINSPFNDYSPIISADGNTMIFTSNRTDDSIQVKMKTNYEDIYITKKVNDEWTTPKKISPSINIESHDAVLSMSPDEKTIYIYYGINGGDIYSSTVNSKGEWGKPVPLNKNINTPQFRETAACVSADGKKLFFASNRSGGKGNLDIYVSELDATGQWGKPVNLGEEVNTDGEEDSPYIHPDGVTLYFSSDGHPGMGNGDIFKSTYKEGKWQQPENLGYPINSMQYDGFFTISRDKSTAYFTSRRKYGSGEYDIIKATYRNVYYEPTPVSTAPVLAKNDNTRKPAGAVIVQGKAFDKTASTPLPVTISVVDFKTQRQVASIKTSGNYELPIKQPGKYIITAEAPGYLFNSVNINVTTAGTQKIVTDFGMVKVNVGSVMVLKNIFFDIGKADLKPASLSELEKVRAMLLANPQLRVQINGHTDNVGDPELNKTLSLKRALMVVNHLALNGIEFDRLSAKGYGAEKPIASNDDETGGREMNRRTEIEILQTDRIAYSN